MLSDVCIDFISDERHPAVASAARKRLKKEIEHYSQADFGYPADAIALAKRAITMNTDGILPLDRLTTFMLELAAACHHGTDDSAESMARLNEILEG